MPRLIPPPRLRSVLFRLANPRAAKGFPERAGRDLATDIDREFAPILRPYALDAEAFRQYKADCGYAADYVRYMGPDLLDEKLLEHFVSLDLLGAFGPGEIQSPLIDIGAAVSPFTNYVRTAFGVKTLILDLDYPAGVHDDRIGAPADAIPLPDASVGSMTLHCTIDHFEGNADTGFLREAARALRPGGRVCVLPVYFAPEPTNLCDPSRYAPSQRFDADARVRAVKGYANRFGRYYSLESFRRRILDATPLLKPTLFRVEGDRPKIPNNYLHYALVMERLNDPEPGPPGPRAR